MSIYCHMDTLNIPLFLFFLIQDILYFKVYLMSCYLSYCPPSCPLRDLPVVLASSNQRFVIRHRLICKAGTGERLLELVE